MHICITPLNIYKLEPFCNCIITGHFSKLGKYLNKVEQRRTGKLPMYSVYTLGPKIPSASHSLKRGGSKVTQLHAVMYKGS